MSRPNKLILEEESEEGVTTLRQLMKLLKMNDSIVRLRIEIESEKQIGVSDLPTVEEDEVDITEEEQQEAQDDEPEPEPEPEFQSTDSITYKVLEALVTADQHGHHLDQLRDEMGGPDEAPDGLSSFLYGLTEKGYVDKQKHKHPQRDRKMYRYYPTTKGERAVEEMSE